MRYFVIPFLLCAAFMLILLHYATATAEVDAAQAVLMDAGVSTTPTPPPVDVIHPPDPIASPAGTWATIVAWGKKGRWIGIALGVLVVATAYRKRMQPGPDEVEPIEGWRSMSIAISSALIAVAGPLVELGTGTGSLTAVMLGAALAVGLLTDKFNPPKKSVESR